MHIITGQLRKEPFTKEGQNSSGNYKMYIIELSERVKDRSTDEFVYTNYSATFFASSDAMRGWYDEAFQVGKVVTVSSSALMINQREHNGNTYITLQLEMPRLEFSQRGEAQQASKKQAQAQKQSPQPQRKQPDFDDDIPF